MNTFLVELRRADDTIEKTHEEDRPPTVPVAKQVRFRCTAFTHLAAPFLWPVICHQLLPKLPAVLSEHCRDAFFVHAGLASASHAEVRLST